MRIGFVTFVVLVCCFSITKSVNAATIFKCVSVEETELNKDGYVLEAAEKCHNEAEDGNYWCLINRTDFWTLNGTTIKNTWGDDYDTKVEVKNDTLRAFYWRDHSGEWPSAFMIARNTGSYWAMGNKAGTRDNGGFDYTRRGFCEVFKPLNLF